MVFDHFGLARLHPYSLHVNIFKGCFVRLLCDAEAGKSDISEAAGSHGNRATSDGPFIRPSRTH